jgi:hypothetical protein
VKVFTLFKKKEITEKNTERKYSISYWYDVELINNLQFDKYSLSNFCLIFSIRIVLTADVSEIKVLSSACNRVITSTVLRLLVAAS